MSQHFDSRVGCRAGLNILCSEKSRAEGPGEIDQLEPLLQEHVCMENDGVLFVGISRPYLGPVRQYAFEAEAIFEHCGALVERPQETNVDSPLRVSGKHASQTGNTHRLRFTTAAARHLRARAYCLAARSKPITILGSGSDQFILTASPTKAKPSLSFPLSVALYRVSGLPLRVWIRWKGTTTYSKLRTRRACTLATHGLLLSSDRRRRASWWKCSPRVMR